MRKRPTAIAVVALATVLAGAAPAAATPLPASCRAVASKVRQPDPLAPLVVGDSVTVSAGKYLGQLGFSVDAVACRSWVHGLEAMAARRLPDLVVAALGSNGDTLPEQLDRALELVGPFGRLVLVLPKALGGRPDRDGRLMRAFEQAHPDQVTTLDWPAYSAGQGGWFQPDGLHLTTPGAQGFARMIEEGVQFGPAEEARPAPRPKQRVTPHRAPTPRPKPLLAGVWRSLAHAIQAVLARPLRLLGPLLAPPRQLAPQDL